MIWPSLKLDPRANEVEVFKEFFTAGLRMPPHPVLVDILHKFWVQLHHFFTTESGLHMLPKVISSSKQSCSLRRLFDCWASHAATSSACGYFAQLLGSATSLDAKCHRSNQQVYLGCHFLQRPSEC
jgi:hypothetical protein